MTKKQIALAVAAVLGVLAGTLKACDDDSPVFNTTPAAAPADAG